jgi:enediyne biosynthesis protein E4
MGVSHCVRRAWMTVGLLPGLLSVELLQAAGSGGPIQLRDVTQATGVGFIHTDGSSGRHYIVETVASGLALFDYDGDGLVDIYFLNGAALPGAEFAQPPRNALYRNLGGWKFRDVTEETGVGDIGYALGVCIGDYNNDGHPDIYVNNFGPNVLYRNNGDGTFTDVTAEAGVAAGDQVGAGAAFLDIDGDGYLDLFVANYVAFNFQNHQISHMSGFPSYVGPLNYAPTANMLFRNNGDGTFSDVSVSSGIAAHLGTGMGIICLDYDGDGDTDIVVGNDLRPNFVFRNDGKGHFTEVGLALGLAYDALGNVHGTMAVEAADWNNDGWPDIFTTSYQRQLTTLYQSHRGVFFEDVTRNTGAGTDTYPQVTWGTGLIDFDNDGHRDLFIACGHLIDNVDRFDDTTSYHARNLLLWNNRQGRFVNVSDEAGDGMLPMLSSRGAAFDDLDNDGLIDVVILNSRREPTILRNVTSATNHWIQVQLRGVKSNRDGVGARVTVKAGDLTQIGEVHSGRSYQSDFGKRLPFGLGQRRRIDELQVNWIGGGTDIFRNLEVNRLIHLVEGTGEATPAVGGSR